VVNDNERRQAQPGLVEIAWHCSCGVSAAFTAEPALAAKMRRAWESIHAGPEHVPVDAAGAAAAADHDIAAIEDMAREVRAMRWGRPPASSAEV
jgi:hypothetical protein